MLMSITRAKYSCDNLFSELISSFQVELSLSQGYLEGSDLYIKYCNHKMRTDLSIVFIKVSSMEIVSIERDLESTLSDKMGLIGR